MKSDANLVSKRQAVFGGVLLTIAACAGVSPNPSSAPPSATPTGPVSATPPITDAPSPSPSPTLGVTDFHYGKLAPGTYRSIGFEVPVTFTVESELRGWAGIYDEPTKLQVRAQRNAADTLIFDIPSGFLHHDVGLLESLRMDVELSDEVPVRIGGLTGTQVEFIAPQLKERPRYTDPQYFPITLGRVNWADGPTEQDGSFFAVVGDHIRLTQVDLGDRLLVILVVAKSAAEYPLLIELADSLLATIQFE